MPAQTLLDIQSRARANPKRIALCDAFDERMLRAALKGIGLAEGLTTLSSVFLMCFPAIPGFREHEFALAFADGAVLPDPSAEHLADIAITTASTYQHLTGIEPYVAMFSFSTKG